MTLKQITVKFIPTFKVALNAMNFFQMVRNAAIFKTSCEENYCNIFKTSLCPSNSYDSQFKLNLQM